MSRNSRNIDEFNRLGLPTAPLTPADLAPMRKA